MKSILLHVAALAVSSALALSVWLRDEDASQPKAAEVEVWSGRSDAVEAVIYESSTRKVRLEPRKDEIGRWYVAHFEKTEEQTDAAERPPHPVPLPSASGTTAGTPSPAPATPPKRTSQTFVGVKEADELVKRLAPLLAIRSVGKFDPKRAADFGLEKPEGTLRVKVGGKEHVLTIGEQTPGGGERYAKYGTTGEVFAIPSDLTQGLAFADTRLMERELHAFPPEDVMTITLHKGGKTRSFARVTGKQDAWADAATPAKADETISNFLTKLERVRVTDYVEKPAPAPKPENLVVRVEYGGKSKSLGYLELYRLPGEKAEYLAKSEYSRWHAKVVASAAEQVDRDLATLLK